MDAKWSSPIIGKKSEQKCSFSWAYILVEVSINKVTIYYE